MQHVINCTHLEQHLAEALDLCPHDRLFVLTDHHTRRLCWPQMPLLPALAQAIHITIPPTDTHKTLHTLQQVWTALQESGATRHSLMLCLGGGMVTDLGGFAAATFKRGMAFVHIPTTLLGMVDAAVGGKTGVNYGGLKNEIGLFAPARAVLLCTTFLRTLEWADLCSGYAEMLKHGLVSDQEHWAQVASYPLEQAPLDALQPLVVKSVAVKQRIVAQDPTEQGIRKALNLGHTIGHALESLALGHGNPVPHGYAVAWGLVCELYLSLMHAGLPQNVLAQTLRFVRTHYGSCPLTCKDYDILVDLMAHDKKNRAGETRFTLLSHIGHVCTDQAVPRAHILESLDFLRENG